MASADETETFDPQTRTLNAQTETFDPQTIAPRDTYSLLSRSVTPRPIALVSTLSAEGRRNLAPFSFFNAGGHHPPSVVFSVTTPQDGHAKDTLRNIKETGEFVVHIVPFSQRDAMNMASAPLPFGQSEWDLTTLTPVSCVKVKPPRAAEFPIALECKLFQTLAHGSGAGSAQYIIGEVLLFHVSPDIITDGHIDPVKLDTIGRLGGDGYVRVWKNGIFDLPRPA